jgi:hypothetical protein
LAYAKFAEDNGGHGALDIFKLAKSEVTNEEAVADAVQEHTEIVHPCVVVFVGTSGKKLGVLLGLCKEILVVRFLVLHGLDQSVQGLVRLSAVQLFDGEFVTMGANDHKRS